MSENIDDCQPYLPSKPIVHIDCDAFFTSVEQALNPSLKGKPVITGKERGIVACASYEAKALGIKRPMRLFEAKKILPSLICLPSDYETYSLYSKRMFSIMREFTCEIEEYSIDEAFIDLSGAKGIHYASYEEIARRMKMRIQKQLGLTVSAGVSASKTLAKIASKQKKPDGFTVLPVRDLPKVLPTIELERVCGFGPSTVALLMRHGVFKVWDFVKRPQTWVRKLLGKTGVELWHELRGGAVYPLVTREKESYQSICKAKTFTPASSDKNFVRAQLFRNLESAFIKLRRHHLRSQRLTIFLRDHLFQSWGLEKELPFPTASIFEVLPHIDELFERLFDPGKAYRLSGVILGRLEKNYWVQSSFLEGESPQEKNRALDAVIDQINNTFGKHKLHLGTSLWLKSYKQHLSDRGDIPLRKQELLKGENFRQHLRMPIWNVKI